LKEKREGRGGNLEGPPRTWPRFRCDSMHDGKDLRGGNANDFVFRALLPTQEGTAWSQSVRRLRNRRPQISRRSQTGWEFVCRQGCLAHSLRRCLARSSHRDGNTSSLSRIQTLSRLKTSTGFSIHTTRACQTKHEVWATRRKHAEHYPIFSWDPGLRRGSNVS